MKEMNVTELMLRLCYHCEDVDKCETEEKCVACFKANDKADIENAMTRELLRLYAY